MVATGGREPEPTFGDALAGSGGMSEPAQPNLFAGPMAADVFPDALSGILLADVTVAVALPVVAQLPAVVGGQVPTRPATQRRPAVAAARQVPQRSWSGAVRSTPGSPPAQFGSPAPAQPWSPVRPAGPPGRYAAVPGIPTVAALSRRPTAGTGNAVVVPASGPGRFIRPPAYLPQGVGLAQVRAAVRQARHAAVTRSRITAEATRRRGAGLWGALIALLLVLVVTGLAEKIIKAISHLLQGT
jgi:hypothetical protein